MFRHSKLVTNRGLTTVNSFLHKRIYL